jgi:hypothetical protein
MASKHPFPTIYSYKVDKLKSEELPTPSAIVSSKHIAESFNSISQETLLDHEKTSQLHEPKKPKTGLRQTMKACAGSFLN